MYMKISTQYYTYISKILIMSMSVTFQNSNNDPFDESEIKSSAIVI